MSKDAVLHRLRIGETRVFPEKRQYRFGVGDDDWFIPKDLDSELLNNGTTKSVLMRNVLTGETFRFDKLSDLCKVLKKSPSAMTKIINRKDQPVLRELIQVKLESDSTPWREVYDPYLELDKNNGNRIIVVYDTINQKKIIYSSAVECAKEHNLLPTTLNWRLKQNPSHVYKDGCSYSYYSNYKGPTNQ